MQLQGVIKSISEVKQYGKYKKIDLVLETTEQYPQFITIEFSQDNINLLDEFAVEDFVNVSINIKGRKWTDKQGDERFFNSISGWKIDFIKEFSK